jgi:hypothetical protein
MSDDVLVDEYVNRPRVAEDTQYFASQLNIIIDLIDKINNTKVSIGSATGMKELVKGAKDAQAAIDKLRQSKDDLSKIDLNEAKAAKELAMAEKLLAQARKENADAANKERQANNAEAKKKEKDDVNSLGYAYREYSKAARDASLRAKSYALTLGENHPTTVAAIKDAKEMNETLRRIDASVGQNQRNVGNYKSAYDGLGVSFAQISRELPSLTISVQQFALAISNNLPMLSDEIGKAKDKIAEAIAEGKEAPSLFSQITKAALSFQVGLSIGIALLTAYAGEVAELVTNLFDAEAAARKAAKEQAEYNERIAEAIRLRDGYYKDTDRRSGTEQRNLENLIAYGRAAGKSEVEILKLEKALTSLKAFEAQGLFNSEEETTGLKGEVALEALKKNLGSAEIAYDEFLKKKRLTFSLADKIFAGSGTTELSKDEQEEGKALKAEFDRQTFLFDRQKEIVENYYDANRDDAVKDLELQRALAEQRISFFADELRYRADIQKSLSENEEAGLSTRLRARASAFIKEKQIIEGQRKDEIAGAKNDASKIFEINRKASFDNKKLAEEYANDIFLIRQQSIARRREQEKEDNDQFIKDQEERLEKEIAVIQSGEAKRQLARAQGIQLERHALDTAYIARVSKVKEGSEARKKLDEKYAKDRADLEYSYAVAEVNSAIQQAELIIAAKKRANQDTTAEETELAKLRMKLSDITTQHILDNGKKEYKNWQDRLKDTEKGLQSIQGLWKGATTFISGLVGANTDKQKNDLEDQKKAVEDKSRADIDAINASALTTQEKADQIAIVEAKAASKKEELTRKQAQLDEKRAKFDKAANIGRIAIETALAVVHQLSSGDPFTAIPRAIAAGALGAAELAVAIATPIPKFKDGRDGGPATAAIVGDGGKQEVITSPDLSQAYVTPKSDTLTYLQKDWKVFPDIESFQASAGGSVPVMHMAGEGGSNDRLIMAMAREIGSLKSVITSMPQTKWVMTADGFRKFQIRNNEVTEYLNANF